MSSNGENAATATSDPVAAPRIRHSPARESPSLPAASLRPAPVANQTQSCLSGSVEQPCVLNWLTSTTTLWSAQLTLDAGTAAANRIALSKNATARRETWLAVQNLGSPVPAITRSLDI